MADQVRADQVRVIIQMSTTPALAAASFGPVNAAPAVGIAEPAGVELDPTFSPVPIPPKPPAEAAAEPEFSMAANFSASEPPTHVIRAGVLEDAFSDFLERANNDENVVGVFADARIGPLAVNPRGPVGTDLDVEQLLMVEELHQRGMDGAGVPVCIVDSGISRSR